MSKGANRAMGVGLTMGRLARICWSFRALSPAAASCAASAAASPSGRLLSGGGAPRLPAVMCCRGVGCGGSRLPCGSREWPSGGGCAPAYRQRSTSGLRTIRSANQYQLHMLS